MAVDARVHEALNGHLVDHELLANLPDETPWLNQAHLFDHGV